MATEAVQPPGARAYTGSGGGTDSAGFFQHCFMATLDLLTDARYSSLPTAADMGADVGAGAGAS